MKKKALRINLKNNSFKEEIIDNNIMKEYLGGRGLGARYIYDEINPKADPLSPDNKIIIACGLITESGLELGARYMMLTKSPLSNGITFANSGGYFGHSISNCGYFAIIIEETASQNSYLYIDENKVSIFPADDIWGKTTSQTIDILKKLHGDISILCIGSAGEYTSNMAIVVDNDGRAAGRGGVGAVMGSKNIKAIVCKNIYNNTNNLLYLDSLGTMFKKSACHRCPKSCIRLKNKADKPKKDKVQWPIQNDNEYSKWALIANNLCDEYGLDRVSVSSTITLAKKLASLGYIKGMHFENGSDICDYIRQIGANIGFGAELAKGSYYLANLYNMPQLAASIKKVELPIFDPKENAQNIISFATSTKVGCHVRDEMINPDILNTNAIDYNDLNAIIDAMGICIYTTYNLDIQNYVDMVNHCFNENLFNQKTFLDIGKRIYSLERLYNINSGMTKDDDVFPENTIMDRGSFQELLLQYYKLRNWDDNGIPTAELLKSLNI